MPTEVSEDEIYRLIKKKAESIREKLATRSFYLHFALYSIVNILLAIIWRFTGAGFPWFAFPVGIWGIAILFHFLAVSVFAGRGQRAQDWVRRVTEKEVERLKEVGMTVEEVERLKEADMTVEEVERPKEGEN